MKLFFEVTLIIIVVCTQIKAQNTNNSPKENSSNISYSLHLNDNEERKIIKYLVSLPEKEWRILNMLIRNDFVDNYKRLKYAKNIKQISLQTKKFIKFLLAFPKKEESKIDSCVKRARYLRDENKENNHIAEFFGDDLPKKTRKFSIVCELLKNAVSAKETVILLRELKRDHIHKPQIISVVKPYLYSNLAESVDVCINFSMMSIFYIVSSEAKAIIAEINTKETNQLLLDHLHIPAKNRQEELNKLITAAYLRNNGYREGALFLDNFIEQKDEGYEIYIFFTPGLKRHPDDLKYYFYSECKNNTNTTGLSSSRITQKLTRIGTRLKVLFLCITFLFCF